MPRKWTVIWTKSAEQELCDMYNAAFPSSVNDGSGEPNKLSVADAANEVDKSLGRDPFTRAKRRPTEMDEDSIQRAVFSSTTR